jgi:hypothetical protein
MGPRAGLDTGVRNKIPSPFRDSNRSIIQPVAQRHTNEISPSTLYQLPPNIIRVIKSRLMIWAGHAAQLGEIRNKYNILLGYGMNGRGSIPGDG